MTSCRFSPRGIAIGAGVALIGILVSPLPAKADQISDKRAQAAQIAAQIDALGLKESALSEQYDKAVLSEQDAAKQVSNAHAQVEQAATEAGQARQQVRQVALESYMGDGTGALAGQPGRSLSSAEQLVLRSAYVTMLTSNRQDVIDRYKTAAAQAKTAENQLAQAQAQAAAQVNQVRTAEQQVQQAETHLHATYPQVKPQPTVRVAQAQAAADAERQREAQAALARQKAAQQAQLVAQQQAAARQVAAAAVASTDPAAPAVPVPALSLPAAPVPVPTGSGGAAAVAAAETRLGDPYVWGAAGPNSFDCSGLTMWAWAHAGVSLPHYSGAQYSATTHIPMSDLQPGDLVFFADPGEHEAMYIGNGQVIEAPHTGANVRIMPLYSQFVLASRP